MSYPNKKMTALNGYCRFVSCESCLPSIKSWIEIWWLLSLLENSTLIVTAKNKFEMIGSLWHDALFCWKSSEDGYTVVMKGWARPASIPITNIELNVSYCNKLAQKRLTWTITLPPPWTVITMLCVLQACPTVQIAHTKFTQKDVFKSSILQFW